MKKLWAHFSPDLRSWHCRYLSQNSIFVPVPVSFSAFRERRYLVCLSIARRSSCFAMCFLWFWFLASVPMEMVAHAALRSVLRSPLSNFWTFWATSVNCGGECENRSLSELSFCNFSDNPARAVGCLLPVSTREAQSWLRLVVLLFPVGMSEEPWGQPEYGRIGRKQ